MDVSRRIYDIGMWDYRLLDLSASNEVLTWATNNTISQNVGHGGNSHLDLPRMIID